MASSSPHQTANPQFPPCLIVLFCLSVYDFFHMQFKKFHVSVNYKGDSVIFQTWLHFNIACLITQETRRKWNPSLEWSNEIIFKIKAGLFREGLEKRKKICTWRSRLSRLLHFQRNGCSFISMATDVRVCWIMFVQLHADFQVKYSCLYRISVFLYIHHSKWVYFEFN